MSIADVHAGRVNVCFHQVCPFAEVCTYKRLMMLIDRQTRDGWINHKSVLAQGAPFRFTIVFDFSSLPPTSSPDNGHATRKNVGACLSNNARTMPRNDFGFLSLSLSLSLSHSLSVPLSQIGAANHWQRRRLDANLFREGTTIPNASLISDSRHSLRFLQKCSQRLKAMPQLSMANNWECTDFYFFEEKFKIEESWLVANVRNITLSNFKY